MSLGQICIDCYVVMVERKVRPCAAREVLLEKLPAFNTALGSDKRGTLVSFWLWKTPGTVTTYES